jgi:SAM-dependent methyltransferase
MKQWYEMLFQNYGAKYDLEIYTKGTSGECDFIEAETGFNRHVRILDIGCGTGRHALELTRRGYKITGVDLSDAMLKRAREKAIEQDLIIDFQRVDARRMKFSTEFDLVIMLCEGAFPLMETDEMNFQILENASKALKSPGKLIFTTLNGLFPLFHSVKDFHAQATAEGNAACTQTSFDLMTFRDHNTLITEDDTGTKMELSCSERYYVPSEITWMLKSLDFKTIDIFGARSGAYSRNDKLTTEDFEMLVIAEK